MKVIIAPDSFKNSCSAIEVAQFIEKGIQRVFEEAEIIKIPIADGGEGTVEAILMATKGTYQEVKVSDALGRKISATYGIVRQDTAIIEMAAASGIEHIEVKERNPLLTSTYGTGELILDALNQGIRKIVLGIGGSATNDGGMGMLSALGIKFLDQAGHELEPIGKNLSQVHTIDLAGFDQRILETDIQVACDVKNPLCGAQGATYVYGKQKGADENMLDLLETGMMHYADQVKDCLKKDYSKEIGTGAAGGLGFALVAFCRAKLISGVDCVLDLVDIEKHLENADLVITGEGKLDGQSIYGKVPIGVATRVKQRSIPVLAIVGGIGEGAEKVYDHGIDTIMPIVNKPMRLEEAIQNVGHLLEEVAERSMRMWQMIEKKRRDL